MSPSPGDAEVIIVGGGIGGAVLALALAKAGHPSVILEREPAPPPARRPEILWPPTLEVLDALGVGGAVRSQAAVAVRGAQLSSANGERLFAIAEEDFEASGVRPWSTDPARTREVLIAAALETGAVEIARGVEAREVTLESGRRVVRGLSGSDSIERRGRLVVGDDGVHSRVRESAGITLETQTVPFEIVGAVTSRLASLPVDEARVFLNPRGLAHGIAGALFLPLPGERTAMAIVMALDAWDRFARAGGRGFLDALEKVTPLARDFPASLRVPDDFGRFRRPIGHADRYVADRLAIIGDAAHPVTPAGGQGANMAVADAKVLSAVLRERLSTDDLSSSALAEYERRRRDANERSIAFSRRARQGFLVGKSFPPARALIAPFLRGLDKDSERKREFLRIVSTAFVSA